MPSKLYFDPSLWLQRQSWVLTKLRQEQVDSVVDVGCANGTLLSALMQPAFQIDSFPRDRIPALFSNESGGSDSNALLPPKHWTRAPADINISRLVGLDVDAEALRNARSALSLHGQAIAESRSRWRSLEVKLFQGQLESYNESLVNYDAFVATEVIEHLEEPALEQFGPTILGKYRPRILLITTPNYCFNEHFGGDLSTRPGFPDPSGRTNRVFRHDDHKFEWTPEEFKKWCDGLAETHGYEVTIGGVGEGIYRRSAAEASVNGNGNGKKRRPRTGDDDDERLRYASQTAFFRRRSASARLPAGEASDAAGGVDEYFGVNSGLKQFGASVPTVAITPSHGHCGEGDNAEDGGGYDDEDDDDDGRGRRARSRRPENLPFLSSPSPSSALPPPIPAAALATVPVPATPFAQDTFSGLGLTHRVLWDELYPCWSASEPPGAMRVAGRSTEVRPASEILAAVVEKLRQLFIAAQWSDYDEGGAKISHDRPVWEAKAKLLDIWYDDQVRGCCAGRVATLLETLQVSAKTGTAMTKQASKLSLSGHDDAPIHVRREEIPVASNEKEWELRVIIDHREHPEPAGPDSRTAADDATSPIDSDLWLVHTQRETVKLWYDKVEEAKRWIPQSYVKPWRSKSLAATMTTPTSWDCGQS